MTSLRKTALVAGLLYLVTFVSSIPAFVLLQPVLTDPAYIVSAGADTQVTAGALARMFGIADETSAPSVVGTVPIFFWELALGLGMTFKGFDPSVPVAVAFESAGRSGG